jgi:hypothetical protein
MPGHDELERPLRLGRASEAFVQDTHPQLRLRGQCRILRRARRHLLVQLNGLGQTLIDFLEHPCALEYIPRGLLRAQWNRDERRKNAGDSHEQGELQSVHVISSAAG